MSDSTNQLTEQLFCSVMGRKHIISYIFLSLCWKPPSCILWTGRGGGYAACDIILHERFHGGSVMVWGCTSIKHLPLVCKFTSLQKVLDVKYLLTQDLIFPRLIILLNFSYLWTYWSSHTRGNWSKSGGSWGDSSWLQQPQTGSNLQDLISNPCRAGSCSDM